MRWQIFIRPVKKVALWDVLATQVIGFTAVALFGRLADLVRPYLVAKKVNLTISSQVAVYAVERTFDGGAMVFIYCAVLLLTPNDGSLPHREILLKGAIVGLIITLFLTAFAVVARLRGSRLAEEAKKAFSPKLGEWIADKILGFSKGLNVIGSMWDFAWAAGISVVMWALITGAYLLTTLAFTDSPELRAMTPAKCLLLMAASVGGSIVQLPIIGWFTTITLTATSMVKFFHAGAEPALGCGAMLMLVTFLSIVPAGLIWSQLDHISLREVAEESEHEKEEIAK
jgi:hypothetical protein